MSSRSPLSIPEGLPALTLEASVRVEEMVTLLRERITNAGGTISLADYMDTTLYAPDIGYYTGGLHKLGKAGDFVTAPEISPLFGRCLAQQVAEMLAPLEKGEVLEVGAGSGALAAELLGTLEKLGVPPYRYLILELSGELRARQAETLAARLPHWADRVEWCTDLPKAGWEGIIVANELLDALPVHRFALTRQGIMEQRVGWGENGFEWRSMPTEGHLASALDTWYARYGKVLGEVDEYVSELALAAPAWLTTLAGRLGRGGMLLVDYGYAGREYYHPHRDTGTLSCHYHHHRHDNPLILPGLQDITAHVNFTAIAEAALATGLEVAGYTTQAYFLIDTGISDALSSLHSLDAKTQLSLTNQIRYLTLPQEMGEIFKVLALTRGLDGGLLGFRSRDLRNRL
ncbi:SAM-dependent methyltransferase [Gammaproteobacteria bacterium]